MILTSLRAVRSTGFIWIKRWKLFRTMFRPYGKTPSLVCGSRKTVACYAGTKMFPDRYISGRRGTA
jgi:hypothetical protein